MHAKGPFINQRCMRFVEDPRDGRQNVCAVCGGTKAFHATESVNHPAHYGGKDDPYEHIKVVQAWGLNYQLGNCTKYIARAGKKDPAKLLEDLKKARFYLDYEIQLLEAKAKE